MKSFLDQNRANLAYDHDEDPVFLARNAWHLDDVEDKYKALTFKATKESAA